MPACSLLTGPNTTRRYPWPGRMPPAPRETSRPLLARSPLPPPRRRQQTGRRPIGRNATAHDWTAGPAASARTRVPPSRRMTARYGGSASRPWVRPWSPRCTGCRPGHRRRRSPPGDRSAAAPGLPCRARRHRAAREFLPAGPFTHTTYSTGESGPANAGHCLPRSVPVSRTRASRVLDDAREPRRSARPVPAGRTPPRP